MKRIKTVKKSIVSLILACAIFVSAFAVSTVSASAASSPKLNLVNPKSSGSFDVVWNIVPNAVKYRIYFGTNAARGNGWRRFTVLNASSCTKHPNYPSFKFTINSSSLRGRTWYKYGDDKAVSTPCLDSGECYKCQVEALGDADRHIAWTNVDYIIVGVPKVSKSLRIMDYHYDVVFHSLASVEIQLAYRSKYETGDHWRYTNSDPYSTPGECCVENWSEFNYQVRGIAFDANGYAVAYGPWSKVERYTFNSPN